MAKRFAPLIEAPPAFNPSLLRRSVGTRAAKPERPGPSGAAGVGGEAGGVQGGPAEGGEPERRAVPKSPGEAFSREPGTEGRASASG